MAAQPLDPCEQHAGRKFRPELQIGIGRVHDTARRTPDLLQHLSGSFLIAEIMVRQAEYPVAQQPEGGVAGIVGQRLVTLSRGQRVAILAASAPGRPDPPERLQSKRGRRIGNGVGQFQRALEDLFGLDGIARRVSERMAKRQVQPKLDDGRRVCQGGEALQRLLDPSAILQVQRQLEPVLSRDGDELQPNRQIAAV